MASAYVGTCLMPPLFGLLADHVGVYLFPVYLLGVTGLMILMHEVLLRRTERPKIRSEEREEAQGLHSAS